MSGKMMGRNLKTARHWSVAGMHGKRLRFHHTKAVAKVWHWFGVGV
jgi:hypothetical protein